MSHIDFLKCQEFLNDTDEHFKKAEVKNFNVIHHKCIDDPLHKDLRTYQSVKKRSFWVQSTAKKRKILFHLPYVANVNIFLLKRQLLTNILRACNLFLDLYKNVYKISCVFVLHCVLI